VAERETAAGLRVDGDGERGRRPREARRERAWEGDDEARAHPFIAEGRR